MNFFQDAACLTARVPRCRCDPDGVKQVQAPWARPGSGFTLMFEALLLLGSSMTGIRVIQRGPFLRNEHQK